MFIKELTINEFNNFSVNHKLNSFYQSQNYALVMSEYGYEYDFIGLINDNEIIGAALILHKKINGISYGYSPRGFLIDYNDNNIVKNFTDLLIKYYNNKKFSFIKVNPNIQISKLDNNNFIATNDSFIKDNLNFFGYQKLNDNLYFESMLPRFTPVIDLKNHTIDKLTKNTRNKIKKGMRKGLVFEKVEIDDIKELNKLMDNQSFYNSDLYSIFSKNNESDLFLVYIDKIKYLELAQEFYTKEFDKNQLLNNKMVKISHKTNINKKMNSDTALLAYKKDVMEATKLAETSNKIVIGAALVINSNKKAEIVASAYDKQYKRFAPNYFLHYNLIKYYKKISETINLSGFTGDLNKNSKYKGLNEFKIGFAPDIYENIGEFDLIINKRIYKNLLKNNLLQREFSKKI